MKQIDISEIDANFCGRERVEGLDAVYYDVREEPFRIYGLYEPQSGGVFKRIPDAVAEATSKSILSLYRCTAGGRVRFCTNSSFVVIRAKMPSVLRFPHATLLLSAGFDLYIDETQTGRSYFYDAFKPSYEITDGYTDVVAFEDKKERSITLNLPLYGEVEELLIGLERGASLSSGAEYPNEKPVVFYGSSITQGGCASRPGTAYPAVVSRELNIDYINLGFSGNCRAELPMVEYMSGLDMSVFVSDYDHNTTSVDFLRNTHYRMYEMIRKKQPDIPYIMISRPDFKKYDRDLTECIDRRAVIIESFERARALGDENVYFIDGESFFDNKYWDSATVDGIHPNDFGMMCMASKIAETLRGIIK